MEDIEIDGGLSIDIKPKNGCIESKNIIECEIEFMFDYDSLDMGHYVLKSKLYKDNIKGIYEINGEQNEFEASIRFYKEIQKIIDKNHLITLNGMVKNRCGLPEFFGSYMSVLYKSNECLYFKDNEDNHLGFEICMEFINLFKKYCK